MRVCSALFLLFLVPGLAAGQDQTPKSSQPVTQVLRCGALIQPANGQVQRNVIIIVEGERIKEVREGNAPPSGAQVIDLSDHTCLPGLIDAHTHVLLQGDITAEDYDQQLLKQSVAYRTILATRSVRRALDYGFTTIRDVETEGAGYADVDLKRAINRGIVDETHRQHHKVAAHAMALNGVHNAVEAGVDSIEHGDYIADADMKTMVQKGIYYVPTIYVGEYVAQGRANSGAKVWLDMIKIHADIFRKAVNAGVKIAFGTDVGGFDWGINPAIEFRLMVKYGMTPLQAVRSATTTAAELLGMQNDLGSIAPGKYADVVAVKGDPLGDISLLQKIDFVMKGGEVYKSPRSGDRVVR